MERFRSRDLERKERVLGIVIHEYIKTESPISSGYIANEYALDVSSATIRNILAELEKDGLLTHPHTSAGRIPTEIGYRYYVDNLMNDIQLLEEEKQRIQTEYQRGVTELERLLETTTELISDITQYTSIVTLEDGNKMFLRGTNHVVEYPDKQDIDKIRNLLRMLEAKERVLDLINRDLKQKIGIYIGHEIACHEMDDCSLAISEFKRKDGPSGRIAIIGPTRMNYQRVVSTLEYVSNLINGSY